MPSRADEITQAMERIAPLGYAEDWDNAGELIRGSRDVVRRMMLTIDFTEPVLEEAIDDQLWEVTSRDPIS